MNHERHGGAAEPNAKADPGHPSESLVRDEVCGMQFPLAEAAATAQFQSKTYSFCSERCRERFLEHPAWYVPIEP